MEINGWEKRAPGVWMRKTARGRFRLMLDPELCGGCVLVTLERMEGRTWPSWRRLGTMNIHECETEHALHALARFADE